MESIKYLVYDCGFLVGGFCLLADTVNFMEGYRPDCSCELDMVDAHTGEVIDTWVNGKWESGNY